MIALVLQAQTQAPRAPGNQMITLMIYVVGFALIFWFLILRPQRRVQQRHQQMVKELKRGDEVMTEGGIIGSVVHLTDDRVTIKTAENTRVVIARPKIARILSATGASTEEKS